MKHVIPFVVIGVLLMSGLGAAVLQPHDITDLSQNIYRTEQFSAPALTQVNGFTVVSFDHMNSWFNEPGSPMVPAYQQTITLPFGTTVDNVQVLFTGYHEAQMISPLIPGMEPVLEDSSVSQGPCMDAVVYTQTTPVPSDSFVYSIGAGLDGLTHVFYLTITCYPVQYTPSSQILSWHDQVSITVQTTPPAHPVAFGDEYDLLVIAPKHFVRALQPLVDHKNDMGMRTTLMTVENITAAYPGRDAPEKIKYAIKDMIETTGIHYVLLVGGTKTFIYAIPRDDANQGTKGWWVPVRYTNLYDGGEYQDPGYISDLYYADIYNGTGELSTWDSNGDNVFADWKGSAHDIIDLYPDVYVGRLACVNTQEVKTMVNKIITYEETPADPSWFNTMVVIGSDTFNDPMTNYLEGEVENQKALDYMTGFTPVKIWGSNRDNGGLVPVPLDIVKTISKGAGFVAFSGHGSPERWNAYWPSAFNETRLRGLWFFNIPFMTNKDKLPVVVVGGCHNSDFNVTAFGFFLKAPWVYSPVPECFSWLFCRNTHGGAIATMGNTGLGYGATGNISDLDGDGVNDPDCVEALGGYLESQFFKAYGVNHTEILGAAWGAAITQYIHVYPGMLDKFDCKTVQQWALLGDPSLTIGGYSR